ncbi:C40 family peptidase [Nocardiopsis sp. CNT312]|uniref:C40 family peptidase n=1 Tax=Nocardiopsis sp. CNT312 TaxID=1137268 RepID=UPI0004AF71F6|nr:NlpC/P60 family protein [Nocardiopsis sp. CNT312]
MIGLIAMTSASPDRADAPADIDGIPEVLLDAYQQAATQVTEHAPDCEGMTWAVLAGIGKVESNHAAGTEVDEDGTITPRIIGPTLDGSGAGGNTTTHTDTDDGQWDGDDDLDAAVGPMQFIPATWVSTGTTTRDNADPDPHNAYDATLTAAIYLCGTEPTDLSSPHDLEDALWRYNQSTVYAEDVIGWIDTYTQMSEPAEALTRSGSQDDIITAAEDWLDTPYLYGGACNDPATDRCDCSSLARYAYRHATGIELPRTTYDQVLLPDTDARFVRIPPNRPQDLRPGDLLFFGTHAPQGIGHVGLYIDDDRMIEAPRTGLNVRITTWRSRINYYGAVGLR